MNIPGHTSNYCLMFTHITSPGQTVSYKDSLGHLPTKTQELLVTGKTAWTEANINTDIPEINNLTIGEGPKLQWQRLISDHPNDSNNMGQCSS